MIRGCIINLDTIDTCTSSVTPISGHVVGKYTPGGWEGYPCQSLGSGPKLGGHVVMVLAFMTLPSSTHLTAATTPSGAPPYPQKTLR